MHKAGWNGRHLIKIWHWKIIFSKTLNSIYIWDLTASELETLPLLLYFSWTQIFSLLPSLHSSTSELWNFVDVLPFAWNVLYLLVNLKISTHIFIISFPNLGPSLTWLIKCRWALWATLALCAESRLKMASWQHVWISSLHQSLKFIHFLPYILMPSTQEALGKANGINGLACW